MQNPMPRIELLGFPACPNTPELGDRLRRALAPLGPGWTIEEVDVLALPRHDPRRGYPAPTILINGTDLYGMSGPSGPNPGCRVYLGGLPSVEDLASRLAAVGRGD